MSKENRQPRRAQSSAAAERLLDRAAEHELVAHDPHGEGHRLANHRLAAARDDAAEYGCPVGALLAEVHHRPVSISAQVEALTKSDERLAEMLFPVGLVELVADQPVGGLGIRHAQQRLGEAHQHHAFVGRQRVLVQEGVEAAAPSAGPDPLDQFARELSVAAFSVDVSRARAIRVPTTCVSSAK